jgi:hypothetical protein
VTVAITLCAEAADVRKVEISAARCEEGNNKACAELAKIARWEKKSAVRRAAIQKLKDQQILAQAAVEDQDATVRTDAVARLLAIRQPDETKIREGVRAKLASYREGVTTHEGVLRDFPASFYGGWEMALLRSRTYSVRGRDDRAAQEKSNPVVNFAVVEVGFYRGVGVTNYALSPKRFEVLGELYFQDGTLTRKDQIIYLTRYRDIGPARQTTLSQALATRVGGQDFFIRETTFASIARLPGSPLKVSDPRFSVYATLATLATGFFIAASAIEASSTGI